MSVLPKFLEFQKWEPKIAKAEKAAIAGLAVAIVGTFLGVSPAITYGLIIVVSYASAFVKIR